MNIDNPSGLNLDDFEPLLSAAGRIAGVGELLDWSRRDPSLFASPGVLSDVIVQDEFTHDVVVRLTTSIVLAYGST